MIPIDRKIIKNLFIISYHIYSIKRPSAYLNFRVLEVELIRGEVIVVLSLMYPPIGFYRRNLMEYDHIVIIVFNENKFPVLF
jgi:hypothetical protein